MELNDITDREYAIIRDLLFKESGIALGPKKQALVVSRLFKRVQAHGCESFGDYFTALKNGSIAGELQVAIDLLTTNETYFFREPKHFAMLEDLVIAAPRGVVFRVWSAASSTGEEAYTIAITLQELRRLGRAPNFEVRASDLNTSVLEQAKTGLYNTARTEGIPDDLKKRYFLRGTGPYEGSILVDRQLREKIEFARINLIEPLPELVPFDVIFLRNVLIYFDLPVKRKVVSQLLLKLKPNGVLFVGMAETLNGLINGLISIGPGAYRMDRRR